MSDKEYNDIAAALRALLPPPVMPEKLKESKRKLKEADALMKALKRRRKEEDFGATARETIKEVNRLFREAMQGLRDYENTVQR